MHFSFDPSSLVAAVTSLAVLSLGCGGQTVSPNNPDIDSGATTDTAGGETTPPADGDTPDVPISGDPITAPDETWTWIPIAGTKCANGSPTGLGVSLTKKSKKALVYLEGGGACWDALSCGAGLAVNLSGYDEGRFKSDISKYGKIGPFDRTDPANPFKDYSHYFVPYCTGDVHAGNKSSVYGGKTYQHVGFLNTDYDFARIVPTLKAAGTDYVVLSGSSAGGFGALWNFPKLQDALGAIHVDVVDDAGPPLRPPYMPTSLQTTWNGSWGLNSTVPAGCDKCNATDGYHNAVAFLATKYAGHRVSLISSLQDKVIRQYFGLAPDKMQEGLNDFADTVIKGLDGWRVFYVTGDTHTYLGNKLSTVITGTPPVTLATFLTQEVTNDPAWVSVRP